MANVRKRHTAESKAKVAGYGVHATQTSLWKKQAQAGQQGEVDKLHRQIGQRVADRPEDQRHTNPAKVLLRQKKQSKPVELSS